MYCKQAHRQVAVQHACELEVKGYQDTKAKIQSNIEAVQQTIEEAKLSLREAQVVRQHEEEYEASSHFTV
jgi:Skp family chaperone for outer membrane proteins